MISKLVGQKHIGPPDPQSGKPKPKTQEGKMSCEGGIGTLT